MMLTPQRLGVAMACAAGVLLGLFAMSRFNVPRPPPDPRMTPITFDPGVTTTPALSPDGRLLAYASDRAGAKNLDLYVWVSRTDGPTSEALIAPQGKLFLAVYIQTWLITSVPPLFGRLWRDPPFNHEPSHRDATLTLSLFDDNKFTHAHFSRSGQDRTMVFYLIVSREMSSFSSDGELRVEKGPFANNAEIYGDSPLASQFGYRITAQPKPRDHRAPDRYEIRLKFKEPLLASKGLAQLEWKQRLDASAVPPQRESIRSAETG